MSVRCGNWSLFRQESCALPFLLRTFHSLFCPTSSIILSFYPTFFGAGALEALRYLRLLCAATEALLFSSSALSSFPALDAAGPSALPLPAAAAAAGPSCCWPPRPLPTRLAQVSVKSMTEPRRAVKVISFRTISMTCKKKGDSCHQSLITLSPTLTRIRTRLAEFHSYAESIIPLSSPKCSAHDYRVQIKL